MKDGLKNFIREFMLVSFGKAGINIRLSKFGTFIFAGLFVLLAVIGSRLVIEEVAQRNREIEKHRRRIKELEKTIDTMQQDLDELQEFKELMEAIQNLSKRTMDQKEQNELATVIYRESKKYKYDWRMIMAVIMTESSFRARLRSKDPSYGLMQIKYRTAKEAGKKLGVEFNNKYELYGIERNVLIGAYYLFEQIIKFNDIKKGIVAYNLGPTKTRKIEKRKGGGDIETSYLKKVLNNYNYLKENYTASIKTY